MNKLFCFLFALYLCISYVNGACCIVHESADSCGEEETNECVWLEETNPLVQDGKTGGAQCISKLFMYCLSSGDCPPASLTRPPKECIFPVCTNDMYPINAAIVVDESGSVSEQNYLISLDFVENMLERDFGPGSNVALLAFGAVTDHVHEFSTDRASLLAALQEERKDYARGSSTRIGLALAKVAEMFDEAEIPESEVNMVFVLTDGQPTDSICHYRDIFDAKGIDIYVVGISDGFKRDRVRCLTGSEQDILDIRDFVPRQFYKLESKLRNVICPTIFTNPAASLKNFAVSTVETTGTNSHFMLWTLLFTVCTCAVIYYLKQKVCASQKNTEYTALVNQASQQYV